MVRSCWKWTLAGAWVWGGVVAAQSPYRVQEAPPKLVKGNTAATTERRIFVDEPGKPKQECRVLHEWITDDGHRAMDVQALASGAVSTILMPGPGSVVSPNAPAGLSRVFHWQNGSPPPGAPVCVNRSVSRPVQPVAQSAPAQAPRRFVPSEPVTKAVPVAQPAQTARHFVPSEPMAKAAPVQPAMQQPGRHFVSSQPVGTKAAPVPVAEPPTIAPGQTMVMRTPPPQVVETPPAGTTMILHQAKPEVATAQPAHLPLWKRVLSGESQPAPAAEPTPTTKAAATKAYQSPVQRGELPQRSYVPPAKRGAFAKQETAALNPQVKSPPPIAQLPPPTDLRQSWGDTSGEPVQDPKAKVAKAPADVIASLAMTPTRTELPKAAPKSADPLMQPERYARRPGGYFDLPKENSGGSTSPSPLLGNANSPEPTKMVATPNATKSDAPGRASTNPKVPLGAASVMAAYGNRDGQVIYLPVPVVTTPSVTQMPRAPQLNSPPPQPPRPVDDAMVNAFSSPAAVHMAYGQQAGNAFAPPDQVLAMQQQAMMQQQMVMHQQMLAQQQLMQAQLQAQAAQTAMVMPQPAAVPVGYQAQQPTNTMMVQQLLQTLKEALMPSHREWAAESLGSVDWRTYPQVVDALLTGSREDLAGSVRAACIRSLGRMKVSTASVSTAMQALRADTDPRVRQEADQVLTALGIAPAKEPEIQPAGGESR